VEVIGWQGEVAGGKDVGRYIGCGANRRKNNATLGDVIGWQGEVEGGKGR
jgi:hypothetical protein